MVTRANRKRYYCPDQCVEHCAQGEPCPFDRTPYPDPLKLASWVELLIAVGVLALCLMLAGVSLSQ